MTFYDNLNDNNQFNLGLPFLAKYPTVYSLAAGAAPMACLSGSVAVHQPLQHSFPCEPVIICCETLNDLHHHKWWAW